MTVIPQASESIAVMYTRRRALALGAIGIGALSGCSSTTELAGSGPIERSAASAILPQSVVSGTEYELSTQRERTVERTVSAAGQERTISATNQVALYQKAIDNLAQGSLFGVVSTPGFTIAGQTLNPVAGMSNSELIDVVGEQFNGLSGASEVSTLTKTMFGTDTTVSKFDATANFGGREFDIYIYTGSVVHQRNEQGQSDVVIGAGGYPQAFDETEADTIEGFFGDIEHPA